MPPGQIPLPFSAAPPAAPASGPAPDPVAEAHARYRAACRAHHDRAPGADWRTTQSAMIAAWRTYLRVHLAHTPTRPR